MNKLIETLNSIHDKRIELVTEYITTKKAEQLLDEHGKYYELVDDQGANNSTYGKTRYYFLIDHKGTTVVAGVISRVKSYLSNRNATGLLIDKTKQS